MEKEYGMKQVRVGHTLTPIDLAKITGLIKRKVAYFDRVKVWFRADTPLGDAGIVKALCRGGAQQITTPMRYKSKGEVVESPVWLSCWDLRQPSDAVFEYLRDQ